MTPKPAEYEVLRRPVWDPAPGTACLWQCLKEKPLALHRLSDRVLGALFIAIDAGLIINSDCDLNESDLGEKFKIRSIRFNSRLGHGLLTPDGKGVVTIPANPKGRFMTLRGSGIANTDLPKVTYNRAAFQEKYPNFNQWLDELVYFRKPDGTFDVKTFKSYPTIEDDSTPPDWPRGLTRDRRLASEAHYRLANLNMKTGLPRDASGLNMGVRQASPDDRKRKAPSDASDNTNVRSDLGDDIDTPANSNKKQKKTTVEGMPPASPLFPKLPQPAVELPRPAITPMEVHTAAIQAAFQDKSANRTELFWALLPYITLAEAEDILIRRKGPAAE